MEGGAHWTLLVMIGFGALWLVALVAYGLVFSGRGTAFVRRKLVCPANGEQVDCGLHRDTNGRFTEVRTCSRFSPASFVDCAQGCLRDANARADASPSDRRTSKVTALET